MSEAATAKGVVAGRLQRWISTMVLLGALARTNADREEPNRGLLLKGGVAMELRLGLEARATKDVDFIFHGERRQSWQTLQVEVSPSEIEAAESDDVPAIEIDDLGLTGPKTVLCLPLRYQIAQKIHACTERFNDSENDRSRDLIDLILLRDLVEDLPTVREACVTTFERRDGHGWPPEVTIEPSWPDTYAAEAKRYGFAVHTVHAAAQLVREFIAEVAAA